MEGNFGVFDYTELLAEYGNDVDADEHLRALAGNHTPVYESEMRVAEIPEDYDLLHRTLIRLRKSRDRDRTLFEEWCSMTRECDNDECDYETFVNEAGKGDVRWQHVPECVGPTWLDKPKPETVRPGSFLEFLLQNP